MEVGRDPHLLHGEDLGVVLGELLLVLRLVPLGFGQVGEASELIFWTSFLVDLFDEASKLIFTSFSWLSLTREASVLILITSPQCFELSQAVRMGFLTRD